MKTVVVSGPESVGKTTLCLAIKEQLGAVYVPEFARTYVEQIHRNYTYEDVECIAKQQITELNNAIESNPHKEFVVMDTYLIVTKVWFLHVYDRYPRWLQTELKKAKIDLFLLLKPDIPWVYDPVRENPHIRTYLYDWYKRELDALSARYVEIEGMGKTRTQTALRAIYEL
ncbi:MAG: ATP-binding protein [Prevotellaceae bacterium]|jgi:nicotinamide riboside kinase|nr:ATP-binding protein [Prevotellaceae bacterium]